jgi:hypothetical protein
VTVCFLAHRLLLLLVAAALVEVLLLSFTAAAGDAGIATPVVPSFRWENHFGCGAQ